MMRRILLSLLFAACLATIGMTVAPAFAQQTVIIPNRVIYPGETITRDALEEVPLRRKLKNPQAVAWGWGQLDGKVARRTLLPGRIIAVASLREAWLVEAGSAVKVNFVHGGLEITVTGVPLQAGAAGDMIKVRNVDTGVVFSGIVMSDGSVRVTAS